MDRRRGEARSRTAFTVSSATEPPIGIAWHALRRAGQGPLHWWTARALAGAIGRRALSGSEVVRWHLERIANGGPRADGGPGLLRSA
jgi:hypothetical protein